MSRKEAGETLLIAGAGSGLGLESAIYLAGRDYRVFGTVLNDGEEDALTAEVRRRRVEVEVLRLDITNEQLIRASVDTVMQSAGRIDGLVIFAGLGLRGFFEDLDLSEIRQVFEVNVFGTMALLQAVIPHMRNARHGRIVLTTSIAGRMASMSIGGYASSKFAMEGVGECLRQELWPFNIYVTLLEPALVFTPHFTVNRNRARRAVDPASAYYRWFCQHEQIVDRLLALNQVTPADVAVRVWKILRARRPRLRYVVGGRAKMVLFLRRYTPGEWFESLYWGVVRRMVTQPRDPCTTLSPSAAETSER